MYAKPTKSHNVVTVARLKTITQKKRSVVIIRQRSVSGKGADKTRVFMTKSDGQKTTLKIALDNIERGTTIHADEHRAYDVLHSALPMLSVNHAERYKDFVATACTYIAESFISCFRRMQYGQNNKFDNIYVDRYENKFAYREDTRRKPNGRIFMDILKRCANHLPSRDFCGNWQGNHRTGKNLFIG